MSRGGVSTRNAKSCEKCGLEHRIEELEAGVKPGHKLDPQSAASTGTQTKKSRLRGCGCLVAVLVVLLFAALLSPDEDERRRSATEPKRTGGRREATADKRNDHGSSKSDGGGRTTSVRLESGQKTGQAQRGDQQRAGPEPGAEAMTQETPPVPSDDTRQALQERAADGGLISDVDKPDSADGHDQGLRPHDEEYEPRRPSRIEDRGSLRDIAKNKLATVSLIDEGELSGEVFSVSDTHLTLMIEKRLRGIKARDILRVTQKGEVIFERTARSTTTEIPDVKPRLISVSYLKWDGRVSKSGGPVFRSRSQLASKGVPFDPARHVLSCEDVMLLRWKAIPPGLAGRKFNITITSADGSYSILRKCVLGARGKFDVSWISMRFLGDNHQRATTRRLARERYRVFFTLDAEPLPYLETTLTVDYSK